MRLLSKLLLFGLVVCIYLPFSARAGEAEFKEFVQGKFKVVSEVYLALSTRYSYDAGDCSVEKLKTELCYGEIPLGYEYKEQVSLIS